MGDHERPGHVPQTMIHVALDGDLVVRRNVHPRVLQNGSGPGITNPAGSSAKHLTLNLLEVMTSFDDEMP